MPNSLAYIVLFSWPLVAWVLFARLRADTALIATVLLGYLFIPEQTGFDLPLLPAVGKGLVPITCAAFAMWIVKRHEERSLRRAQKAPPSPADPPDPSGAAQRQAPTGRRRSRSRVAKVVPLIVTGLVVNIFATWITNQEPVVFGPRLLPGIRPYDIGMMLTTLAVTLLPLWVAQRYLRERPAQISLLKIIALCGLAYSFLVLWEVRMSPQLNVQLYGFFAHDWIQHLRGGFRPIVFLAHGLRVGIFLAMAVLAAGILARTTTGSERLYWLFLSLWLMGCLALSRNLGATMIASTLLPVILFMPARVQFLVGLVVATMVLIYPLARGSGLTPAEQIVSVVKTFNAERAGSLNFRLEQEDFLLQKANQKPLSGWGGWGRWLIYNEETGKRESIPDGAWIITMGDRGWIGYLGTFGLLCLPAIFAALRARRFQLDVIDSGIVLLLCANLLDLIPNSSMGPLLWLIAGALWARLDQASQRRGTAPPALAPRTGQARAQLRPRPARQG